MADSDSAQPTSSSENDSEFAALLEAELDKDDWGSEDQNAAGVDSHSHERVDIEDVDNQIGAQVAEAPLIGHAASQAVDEPGGAEGKGKEAGICPPHPGYMWNICIRCGKAKEEDDDEKGVALRYLHQGLEVSAVEADRLRKDDLQKLLAQKKLYLVVDLDHTLLNSTRMAEVPDSDAAYLRSAYSPTTVFPPAAAPSANEDDLLYQLPPLSMWTKLRPFVREFLEEAAGLFEMYVYTMGEKLYAQAMARLLDPSGRLFGERVISQQDSTSRKTKDLDVFAVLIFDDTEAVWPKNRANLLVIERYHFFRSSRRQFGLPGESLVEAKKDECSEEGALRGILDTLKTVHADFFAPRTAPADVRQVLASVRRGILSGCHVVFSRIFPQGFPHHESHPLWIRATELGATCSLNVTLETTHVVAVEPGTEKARWARAEGKFVVRPEWLDCCQLTWSHAREEDFPVLPDWRTRGAAPEFARTVDRKEPEPETSSADGTDESDEDVEVTDGERAGPSEAATSGGSGDEKRERTDDEREEGDAKQSGDARGEDRQQAVENGLASVARSVGNEESREGATESTQRTEHASKRQKQEHEVDEGTL
ncbi:RNA polymerase II c-terminal domain phosphatase-like [Klebsormidium nitens]|uniref:RNA polymerase II C-terminal domain phosphatase-like n=1 Tax=Klebsormidium nitens TaxID=105231 RepID=A0A1Y1IIX8_KLENI|nr:RNA polymerase II c-terminal domain phosphatase-like [Klebsormidium nitens]|eukprot:GAQ89081.1 RNA polymerase II c-terminal domain phosphatase-like [Klebsormidium nitens]